MRAVSPVCWHEATRTWYVTSYELVRDLLTSPSLSARPAAFSDAELAAMSGDARKVEELLDAWPLFTDPPQQTVMRDAVTPAFSRRLAQEWRDEVRSACRDLLAGLEPGEVDLLHGFAEPLATRVTCRLLGLSAELEATARLWSDAVLGYLGAGADPVRGRAAAAAVDEIAAHCAEVFVPGVGESRSGALVHLRGLLGLTPLQVQAVFTQLLTGGIDPVVSALATVTAELVRAPAGSAGVADLAEEGLRLGTPFHFVTRRAAAPVAVGAQTIGAGDRVALVIAAANRDPAVFPRPDEFLPGRGTRHLAFGLGGHFCLGAAMARVVLSEAVGELARWLRDKEPVLLKAETRARFGATAWETLVIGTKKWRT